MKLHLENIVTKVGRIPDQSVELGDGNFNIIAIFESPSNMATVVDIDDEKKKVKNQTPMYNTLVVLVQSLLSCSQSTTTVAIFVASLGTIASRGI